MVTKKNKVNIYNWFNENREILNYQLTLVMATYGRQKHAIKI